MVVQAKAVGWIIGHIPIGFFWNNAEQWGQQLCFISFLTRA